MFVKGGLELSKNLGCHKIWDRKKTRTNVLIARRIHIVTSLTTCICNAREHVAEFGDVRQKTVESKHQEFWLQIENISGKFVLIFNKIQLEKFFIPSIINEKQSQFFKRGTVTAISPKRDIFGIRWNYSTVKTKKSLTKPMFLENCSQKTRSSVFHFFLPYLKARWFLCRRLRSIFETPSRRFHLVKATRIDLSQQPKVIANIDSVSKKYLVRKKFLEQSLY